VNSRPIFTFLHQKLLPRRRFLFLFLFLLLLPAPSRYFTLKVQARRPPLRPLKISLSPPAPYPVNRRRQPPPFLTARSAVVVDLPSATPLFTKNPNTPLPPASTTKIMTALIVLENFSLDEVITVNQPFTVGQTMDLQAGEKLTVESLLYGLLVQSANDAAYALANAFPGGPSAFVAAMNQKARQLHLDHTHFKNPAGLDEPGHQTTARDLAVLSAAALRYPFFLKAVSTAGLTVSDVDFKTFHPLKNINQLLGKVWGVRGIKTGWTAEAGECLVALTEREGHQIVTVVLGSQDRFGETEKLINWVFENFDWQPVPDRF